MALTQEQIEQQRKEAEELLFSGKQDIGFPAGLFFGRFQQDRILPYPRLSPEKQRETDQAVEEVRNFLENKLDAEAIDREADIPPETIRGLGELGVLGMTAPKEHGGRGFTQQQYIRIMELIGAYCASTAVFVNAHHSIGIRALLLYGTEEQKRKWLPPLVTGEKLAAFALTEPQAGSDAANVQTHATPKEDGSGYILNGEKYYITNGGIAGVLTVMARTPVEGSDETKVTAFLVTPDMEGFRVKQERMPKCGIRGTATGWLTFKDMFVPKENVLGQVGRGLQLALNVLNFGRTTFGASCTGAAKVCLELASKHAKQRVQFKQPLSEFELVKKKIAYMAAHAFAMEAATAQIAALIDSGAGDYKLETAMLKVWSTEALWIIVNDTMQIYGGKGYFSDQPIERMMRDARINQIGEGANDVLRAFIAMVGIKPVADQLLGVKLAWESSSYGKLFGFVGQRIREKLTTPRISVKSGRLRPHARNLSKRIRDFREALMGQLFKHREAILFKQYAQERIADAACELYASSCTLSRLEMMLTQGPTGNGSPADMERDIKAGLYYLTYSDRKVREHLAALKDNDDAATTATADAILERF